MDNEQIRTFIAIEFPPDLKEQLREFQYRLKTSQQSFVKWVDPGLMHLTLKFLGNQNRRRIEAIKCVLETSAASAKPFKLRTGKTGCFPGPKNVRVYWIGLDGDLERLSGLQKCIEDSLSREGFPRDTRPFTAHLTLARLRDECSMRDRSSFAAAIQNIQFEPGFEFLVNHIALMKSSLTPKGPIYSRIAWVEIL